MGRSIGEEFLAAQAEPAPAAEAAEPTGDSGPTPGAVQSQVPTSTTNPKTNPGQEPEPPSSPEAEPTTATEEPQEAATATPEEGVPPPPPPRTFKVTIDDEELEVDEQELVKGYQLARVSHSRIQEARERTQAINWTMDQIVKEPAKVFINMAARDPRFGSEEQAQAAWDQLCMSRVRELMHEQSLTPEQQEILAERRKIAREKEAIASHQAKVKAETQERLDRQASERLETEVQAALKHHQLPDNRFIREHTRSLLLDAFDGGINVTVDEAIFEAGKEWRELLKDEKKKKAAASTTAAAKQPVATEFPSTPAGEGALPAKAGNQKPRPKRFDSLRKFHQHVAESV